MALPSTINAWIEELASSLTPSLWTNNRRKHQKYIDGFKRRLRHHNYGRTNQFDVHDQLEGLKEKFQILNRDDLSDALHERMIELREYHNHWIPDALDLLLRVSNNPVQKTRLEDVSTVSSSTEIPIALKWSDLEDDNVIDHHDSLWQAPVFDQASSEEDETQLSTSQTSPASVRHHSEIRHEPSDPGYAQIFQNYTHGSSDIDFDALRAMVIGSTGTMTHIQMIRQILLIVQGHPSTIFNVHDRKIRLRPGLLCQGISYDTLQAFVDRARSASNNLDVIKGWTAKESTIRLLRAAKQCVEDAVQRYSSSVCAIEESLLHPRCNQVASFLEVSMQIEHYSLPLAAIAKWIVRAANGDSITHLDALYNELDECFYLNDTEGFGVLLPIFTRFLDIYLKSVQSWVKDGVIDQASQPFFVQSKGLVASARGLWHDWFRLCTDADGDHRPPAFLKDFAQQIFACGKTSAFTRRIGVVGVSEHAKIQDSDAEEELPSLCSDSAVPFSAALSSSLKDHFTSVLASKTRVLMHLLETRCGMSQTFDAFEFIYLGRQGVLIDIENRIFSRIDNLMDNWNDRFVVADMLEDAYASTDCVRIESIKVRSVHTSSRSMESRRRSVRILGALVVDYHVPELVANIVSEQSLHTYRRVALHLSQVRRAKFVLERTAYHHVQNTAISIDSRDQLSAQATAFILIVFVNTLYDHFTTCIALPLTVRFRHDLKAASNVDAMISLHEAYVSNLAFACLTSKQLKVLRETLIDLLDMCLRFADLASTPADISSGRRRNSDEFETGSFVSAQSRRRKTRTRRKATRRVKSKQRSDGAREHVGSSHSESDDNDRVREGDEDDDDEDSDEFGHEGEGYSSFIVLGDDTTVAGEMGKLQSQFKRQLDFFVAGLRGVGRGSGGRSGGKSGIVEQFDLLADRLQWTNRS